MLGQGGWAAVIGLIRQIHSYERSPDLRRPRADVEGGIRVVFFKLAASLCSPLRPAMKTQRGGVMQYKGLEITAFEQEPGKWRARIVGANGRPLKGDDRQLLESVTSANLSSAVDALTLAMEAVDAAGLFFRNAERGMERFWRVLLRTCETSGRSANPLAKKKPRRRLVSEPKFTDILGDEEIASG
jgi:hypothetical protein